MIALDQRPDAETFMRMHIAREVDDLGAPELKPAFVAWLDEQIAADKNEDETDFSTRMKREALVKMAARGRPCSAQLIYLMAAGRTTVADLAADLDMPRETIRRWYLGARRQVATIVSELAERESEIV